MPDQTASEKLQALQEAGTPGPWAFDGAHTVVEVTGWQGVNGIAQIDGLHHRRTANAAKIVALVNALPALVALVKAAEGIQARAFDEIGASLEDGGPIVGMPDSDFGALNAALAALGNALS